MQVFNPLYDTVFKYLMEDLEIARGLIALIIEQDVVEIIPLPQEQTTFDITLKYNQLPLRRYDYVAAIRSRNEAGEEQIDKVQIEVQRSQIVPEIARFRSYIAEMYRHKSKIDGEERFLPIKTIYFLEKPFNTTLPAVLHRSGTYKDVLAHCDFTGPRDEMVELFNHDSWFIQVELLPPHIQSDLHRVLSVFAPWYRIKSNPRYIDLPNDEVLAHKHALLERIYKRLVTASGNEDLRANLELEQEYNDYIDKNLYLIEQAQRQAKADREQAEADRKQAEADRKQAKADRERAEAERKERESAEEQAKADRDKREAAEQKLITLVKKLHAKGFSKQEIADDTGLSEDEIDAILLQ